MQCVFGRDSVEEMESGYGKSLASFKRDTTVEGTYIGRSEVVSRTAIEGKSAFAPFLNALALFRATP